MKSGWQKRLGDLHDFDAFAVTWSPRLLSILQIMSGLLFLQHGIAEHLKFPIVPMYATFDPVSLSGVAGFLELVGSVLLLVGLFSAVGRFPHVRRDGRGLFHGHFPTGFYPILNRGELAILYCFVFLYLAAAGSGPWSLDAMRRMTSA